MGKQTKEYSVEATRTSQHRKQLFIAAWKSERGCRNCPESDPVALDAHHIDPTNKNPRLRPNPHVVHLYQLSWADLEAELDKCIVLCANCHRKETHRKKNL